MTGVKPVYVEPSIVEPYVKGMHVVLEVRGTIDTHIFEELDGYSIYTRFSNVLSDLKLDGRRPVALDFSQCTFDGDTPHMLLMYAKRILEGYQEWLPVITSRRNIAYIADKIGKIDPRFFEVYLAPTSSQAGQAGQAEPPAERADYSPQ